MSKSAPDYTFFDLPQVSQFLFHPRPEWGESSSSGFQELMIPVEDETQIGARFYETDKTAPNLLFFHGNGEIVADYDDIAGIYRQMNINFFPVDYRGYGKSNGTPMVSSMMNDSHQIFAFVKTHLENCQCSGPLVVMGRSLGSASALEVAEHFEQQFDCLIIESGFAFSLPLLRLLGIDVDSVDLDEEQGFGNVAKISRFTKPSLIIHAELDHIIPLSDGQELFDQCGSKQKRLLEIKGANHNNIFAMDLDNYCRSILDLIDIIMK